MGISVTEYLGQRTDIDAPVIAAATNQSKCPFSGKVCEKIIKGYPPVCSIRNFGRKRTIPADQMQNHPIWIVCEHRLCSTKIRNANGDFSLTEYQKNMLLSLAHIVFENTAPETRILVKSEAKVKVNNNEKQNMSADYILCYEPEQAGYEGKKKLIVEMQGGGETSDTGNLTTHVRTWENNDGKTNNELRSLISNVGILQTNAWRRQQEQALVKSNVADKTVGVDGFVLCIGSCLYNYLNGKLGLNNLNGQEGSDWKVAIITYKEDLTAPIIPGPIPLVHENIILVPTYNDFVGAITRQGKSSPSAFLGKFVSLDGTNVQR